MPLNFPQSPVQIHVPSTACDVVTFLTVKDNCVCYPVQGGVIFQTIPE